MISVALCNKAIPSNGPPSISAISFMSRYTYPAMQPIKPILHSSVHTMHCTIASKINVTPNGVRKTAALCNEI